MYRPSYWGLLKEIFSEENYHAIETDTQAQARLRM
jgi:hypothetical protein